MSAYDKLYYVLDRAFDQAAEGKGKERHAYDDKEPFEKQPICEICTRLGSIDGALFQAVKKIYECKRLPSERAVNELLGAINYIAAAIILLEQSRLSEAKEDLSSDTQEEEQE